MPCMNFKHLVNNEAMAAVLCSLLIGATCCTTSIGGFRALPSGMKIQCFQVELCAGDGQLSRALWSCGHRGKAFDVSWLRFCVPLPWQVLFSKNHDFMRTVGFLVALAAVPRLNSFIICLILLIKGEACSTTWATFRGPSV